MANENYSFKTYPTGAVILAEGKKAPRVMVLILEGNVGVFRNYGRHDEIRVKIIGQGDIHGELSLFTGEEPQETLVALSQVMALVIDRKNVKEFCSNQPEMASTIMEGICLKLAESTKLLQRLHSSSAAKSASRKSKLFPEGHGSYTLDMDNESDVLHATKQKCPLCSHDFDILMVLQSKLRMDRIDSDLRSRYKEFEPLYYDVITCPNCFYSSPSHLFEEAPKRLAKRINQIVGPYKLEMYIRSGLERDTFTVFASYFLAMLCVPLVVDNHQLTTAGLWMKVSWLYDDCGETELARYAREQALNEYLFTYQNLNISESQIQQVTYLLGDLYFRQGKLDNAREFFFLTKTNRSGTQVLKRHADERLEEIRELKLAEKQAGAGA